MTKSKILQYLFNIKCSQCGDTSMVIGRSNKGILIIYCGKQFCENSEILFSLNEGNEIKDTLIVKTSHVSKYIKILESWNLKRRKDFNLQETDNGKQYLIHLMNTEKTKDITMEMMFNAINR